MADIRTLYDDLIVPLFTTRADDLDRSHRRAVDRRDAEHGHLLPLMPVHLLIDAPSYDRIAADASVLVDAQTHLLRHLEATIGRQEMLDRFEVPDRFRRFVDWDELLTPSRTIARFDVIPTADGHVFCEFNVDSCVAGAEISEYMDDFLRDLGADPDEIRTVRSPLQDLADLLTSEARRRASDRIVILDWSTDGGSPGRGYFSFERLRSRVRESAPDVTVEIVDEQTFDRTWLDPSLARRTLVYRGFMMEDVDDDSFLDDLVAAGIPIVNTWETEIRMDKTWFSLFHDEMLRAQLDAAALEVIDRTIPVTFDLNADHLSAVLARKDELIFKQRRAWGGFGIAVGDEYDVPALTAELETVGVSRWIAQEMVDPVTLPIPDGNGSFVEQPLVFGLYVYGRRTNGLLVRVSSTSRVVNVSVGNAKIGWAMPIANNSVATLATTLHRDEPACTT